MQSGGVSAAGFVKKGRCDMVLPEDNPYSMTTLKMKFGGVSWSECRDLLQRELYRVESMSEEEFDNDRE